MNYLWPIIIVVGANTLYNIIAKSTPANVNTFASLVITYAVAAVLSLILFLTTSQTKNFAEEFSKINWTSIVFGFSIIALEFGYINVYRAGWKVSTGSLVANISLACVLLLVGLLFYKESVSLRQIIGMVLCAGGLFLISK
ncbi:MAG: EamA family transporter [Eubacteriaceae bacterium]|nr:EamA family transporter [Eubacteriaceae bacterium]